MVRRSTGETSGNDHFFTKDEQRLAPLPRRQAKKQQRSKNREQARRKVAKGQARIADRGRDLSRIN